jgi:glutamate racemase
MNEKPIGIFDSGIGGLTVLKEIIHELPHENTIYLGDTARVPYGIRSPETVIRYTNENTQFLFSKDIKLLVVACNTASSISLETIKEKTSMPVIGVLDPGARAAVAATKNKRVGIIGTEATINSSSYTKAIKSIDEEIETYTQACPLFVPLVEEGWTDGTITKAIAEIYLQGLLEKSIDTIVLGCTHYPLLKQVIADVMGKRVTLIDSAVETSSVVKNVLRSGELLREPKKAPERKFFVTDSPERFLHVGERFLGQNMTHIEKIVIGN